MASNEPTASNSGDSRGGPFLGWLLSSVGQQAAAGFRTALPEGVHPRQFAVLERLLDAQSADEGLSQRMLAEQLAIPQGRLVALLDELEERGWAERRTVPGDKRTYRLHLTDAGATTALELAETARRYDEELSANLSPDDRARLAALLGALTLPSGAVPRVW